MVANFKETQLTHMRPGQPVQLSVDAYPNREVQRQGGQPASRNGRAVQPVAAGKRRRQLRQSRAARAGQNYLRRSRCPTNLDIAPGMSVEPKVKVK